MDISLSSPGYVVHDTELDTFHMYFYPQRKREIGMHRRYENMTISALKPFVYYDNMHRYHNMMTDLKNIISGHGVGEVCLEGYSYASHSSSSSKLYEFGGILRYNLTQLGLNYTEYAPGHVKKIFSGSGKATKNDMYTAYLQRGYRDLLVLFNLNSKSTSIPNPVQDLVDAIAVLHCLFVELQQ